MWWVWPPPWALGVGLVLVLAAGGVAVRRRCCGTLLCFVLLYCVLSAVVCWQVSLCASAGSGVLRCAAPMRGRARPCWAGEAFYRAGGGGGYTDLVNEVQLPQALQRGALDAHAVAHVMHPRGQADAGVRLVGVLQPRDKLLVGAQLVLDVQQPHEHEELQGAVGAGHVLKLVHVARIPEKERRKGDAEEPRARQRAVRGRASAGGSLVLILHVWMGQGCIGREGTSEAAPEVVRQAVGVGGSYCRLQMPSRPALAVRGTVAGRRLGSLERGTSPPSNAS